MNCKIYEYVIDEGESYIDPDVKRIVDTKLRIYKSKFVDLEATKYVASFIMKTQEYMNIKSKNKQTLTQNLIYLAHHIFPDTKEVLDLISKKYAIYFKIKIKALNKTVIVDESVLDKFIIQ